MHGMYGRFYAQKLHFFRPDTRKQPYVYEWSLIFFFSTNYFLEI